MHFLVCLMFPKDNSRSRNNSFEINLWCFFVYLIIHFDLKISKDVYKLTYIILFYLLFGIDHSLVHIDYKIFVHKLKAARSLNELLDFLLTSIMKFNIVNAKISFSVLIPYYTYFYEEYFQFKSCYNSWKFICQGTVNPICSMILLLRNYLITMCSS